MVNYLKSAAGFLIELIYPEVCMFCDEALDGDRESKRYLSCVKCLGALPVIHYRENNCYSLLSYEGQTEELIKQFKYFGKRRQAHSAGLVMAKYADFDALRKIDAALPVPLHAKRQKQRGYNQAEVICKALAGSLNFPILSGLKRIKETQALFGLTTEQREQAVSGAFDFKPMETEIMIEGKTLLLIDDILTTGATLNECIKVLIGCGAKAVFCMTFAKTELSGT